MCMQTSLISNPGKFNYDGGRIVYECIVPSSRKIIDNKKEYNIDVREFLVTEKNEVINHTISNEIKKYLDDLYKLQRLFDENKLTAWEYFTSRRPGSFDFRAKTICNYLSTVLEYKHVNPPADKNHGGEKNIGLNPWLFPDEMLVAKKGDCVDIALLLASLFICSGISNFNVRVAIGKIYEYNGKLKIAEHDHMWVMYKNESGRWNLIEPLIHIKNKNTSPSRSIKNKLKKTTKIEYEPSFTFNDAHLWALKKIESDHDFSNTLKKLRTKWKGIDPAFAGTVHQDILESALKSVSNTDLQNISDNLINRFGKTIYVWFHFTSPELIDNVDNFSMSGMDYSPFDHFDSGCIAESWRLVNQRIQEANKFRPNDIISFYDRLQRIFHAVADFYAHSSYMHFYYSQNIQQINNVGIENCIPAIYDNSTVSDIYTGTFYDSGTFNLNDTDDFPRFPDFKGDILATIGQFKDKIISGRYGFIHDPAGQNGLGEPEYWVNSILFPTSRKNILNIMNAKPDAKVMPHHDAIAVDESTKSPLHKLYKDDKLYRAQFQLRYNASIRHIQTILITQFGFPIDAFANKYIVSAGGTLKTGMLKLVDNTAQSV